MPAASPSSSSPRPGSSPISWLPIEVFSRILRHLDTPLELYKASLVDHKWRAAATDARLWQPHYWAFYRVQLIVNTKEDQLLLDRRTTNRRNAMRAWIERSTNAAPPSPLGPLASLSPSGEIILYEPLEKGLMMIYSMQGFSEDFIETSMRLNEIAIELYGDRGPDDKDKEEAAERIIAQLVKETGKLPTCKDIQYAELAWKQQEKEGSTKIIFTEQAPSYPPFLVLKQNDGRNAKPLPDFYALFVKRLNEDDRLLLDLRAHVNRDADILDDSFTLLLRYGDAAKDLLIALSAGQQLTAQSVGLFAAMAGAVTTDAHWPRALEVHTNASKGQSQLHLSHCVALQYVAQKLLGHLQRREALRSLRQLQKRFPAPLPQTQSLKERVLQCCQGVEEGMESIALFRGGERSETRDYLALLALFVWKDIETRERFDREGPIHMEKHPDLKDSAVADIPQGSTRRFMTLIDRSLRRLGFAIAVDPDTVKDLDNFYLNASLLCPAQRVTSPLVMCVILCAVARRLGVAAAPVKTTSGAVAMIIEEGEQPEDWTLDSSDWPCFYWAPSKGGRACFYELSQFRRQAARRSASSQPRQDLEYLLEPASPIDVLLTASKEMLLAFLNDARRRHRSALDSDERVKHHHAPLADATSSSASSSEQVTLLRDYLWGRSGILPWPLPPPTLPPSLALLPPTKAGFPRVESLDRGKLTLYCARWIVRILDPNMSGAALKAADNDLRTAIALRNDFHCDAILMMMEQYGLKVKKELDLARKAVKSGRADTRGRGCASEVVGMSRAYIAGVLECDPRKGVRGSGGSPGEERVRELLNHAHPRNAAVKYGIGTVFTHRTNGYRGVVYGWDSVYRAPKRGVWDEAVSVDPSPAGGRKQPHYYAYAEDGCAKYVAQSNVELASILAGSTTEQAAALLRQFVPLFNLRNVAETFRTIQVAEWEAEAEAGPSSGGGGKKEEGGGGEGSGQLKMVMTPWMRSVWPFG